MFVVAKINIKLILSRVVVSVNKFPYQNIPSTGMVQTLTLSKYFVGELGRQAELGQTPRPIQVQ